jgi:acetyl esterase/lipase
MHSWQSYLLKCIFQLKHNLFDRPGKLDVNKDRRELDAMARHFKPLASMQYSPVKANGVPAEWITPQGISSSRAILYIHGGSFNAGSIISHRPLAANIASACRARALIIDYRLAPEFPYPAAQQDCLAAYEWLLQNGYSPDQVAVMGDSAGGLLTLTLLLQLRDLGKPMPALAACLSPATDMTFSGDTWTSNRKKDFMLDRRNIQACGDIYLRGFDPFSPLVSPLYADLHNLPPILIQVGSDEVLLSDCTRFVEKAKQVGVPATLEVWDGMQHVWQYAARFLPEAREAIQNIGRFARQVWRED